MHNHKLHLDVVHNLKFASFLPTEPWLVEEDFFFVFFCFGFFSVWLRCCVIDWLQYLLTYLAELYFFPLVGR
jgi:hypothetical protein